MISTQHDHGMVVHRTDPLNCEPSVPAQAGEVITPNAQFYIRNHFQAPVIDASTWRLDVTGLVERPLAISFRELSAMSAETRALTLECAGNGRYTIDPPIDGEPWRLGAVSTAEWTGVPLSHVLDKAGVRPEAREVVFRGADRGAVEGRPGEIHFERSLPVDAACGSQAVLAYAMNGEELPRQHGYPVRLVVPSWYGVASVKWLTAIELIDRAFDGYFQVDKYWFEADGIPPEPCTHQRVRALITDPAEGAALPLSQISVRGVAWSGEAAIAQVELSINDGPWQNVRLIGDREPHGWQRWEWLGELGQPGTNSIRARATDLAGGTQPDEPPWNRQGYGNNAIQTLLVHVAPDAAIAKPADPA